MKSIDCHRYQCDNSANSSGDEGDWDFADDLEDELMNGISVDKEDDDFDLPVDNPDHKSGFGQTLSASVGTNKRKAEGHVGVCLAHPSVRAAEPVWDFPLPPEIVRHALKFLSPQDLVQMAQACRCLGSVANAPVLWRHLFLLRWGSDCSDQVQYVSWKAAYFQQDAEEIQQFLNRHSDGMMNIYLNMHISRRTQAPTFSEAVKLEIEVIGTRSVAEQVTKWRQQNSLGEGADGHNCSYKTCTYHQIGNVYVCEGTGRAHECGDLCPEKVVDSSGMMVCVVSGRCYENWLHDNEACSDDDHGEGPTGSLGIAFLNGYDCTNEDELDVALWGGEVRTTRGASSSRTGTCSRERTC
mmetsp:Transcript_25715/g.48785  ORF Transcript_25715/g.48785 Transcript_25715/m.48785 type:complete len:354 (-) Transcript_25715:399-1460(-)